MTTFERATRRPGRLTAGVGAVTIAWVALLVCFSGDPRHAQVVSNVGLVVSPLAAGLACLLRSRAAVGASRRFWRLTGLAALSWGAGQTAWTWYESVLGRDVPFPSWADVGYLGMPPLATAALLSLPLAAPTVAGRVRAILDGLMVAASLLVCSWVIVLEPVFHAGDDVSLLGKAISLAYPIGDVVVITIVIYTGLRLRQKRSQLPVSLPLVGAGLICFAVADSGFTYLTTIDAYSSGSAIDVGWFVGYALMVAAALQSQDDAETDDDASVARPLGSLLPSTAVMIALLTSAVEVVRTGHTDLFVSWVRTLIMVLLVTRQLLTLRENRFLTQHLEQRVGERTAQLAASRERFAALVQHSSDVVTVVGADGTIGYQSMSSERLLGFHPRDLEGSSVCDLMSHEEATRFLDALAHAATEPLRVQTLRTCWRHAAGGTRDIEVTITNLLQNPHVQGLVLNSRDVTDRTMLEAELLHQAFHDSLTGLANRALFRDRLGHALDRRGTGHGVVAVIFLDLDGFKEINDTLGHSSGDELLVMVAARLRDEVRAGDTVARFGGDEFAILLDSSIDPADAPALAERIEAAMLRPFDIGTQTVHVSASIGIAGSEGADASDAEQLLRNADLAMYEAKAAPSRGYAIYNPDMHASLVERVQLEADLRAALQQGQFVVHYQPLIDLKSGDIRGTEALVRWAHPERGMVPPSGFIPLAESTGLIRALGLWVLREACAQTVAWQRSSPALATLEISVNVSARQLPDPELLSQVREVLDETGLPASCLTLEMTETVLMDNSDDIRANLLALRELGVRLAIDDFGTGYSSLSYLHRFPVDVLKIDRSFVERLRDGGDVALVSTIVRLGQTMRLETVAEGIEQAEEMLMLRRQGCTTGQGYHFSPPVPAPALGELLQEQSMLSMLTGNLSA